MAGGMFDKAFAAWDALFGTDELKAALEDEQAENVWLLEEIAGLKAEIHTLRSLLETARDETRHVLRLLDEERNGQPQVYGQAVQRQYTEIDAWMDSAEEMGL